MISNFIDQSVIDLFSGNYGKLLKHQTWFQVFLGGFFFYSRCAHAHDSVWDGYVSFNSYLDHPPGTPLGIWTKKIPDPGHLTTPGIFKICTKYFGGVRNLRCQRTCHCFNFNNSLFVILFQFYTLWIIFLWNLSMKNWFFYCVFESATF